jgi:DNA polymerase-3 subunit beta
MEFNISREIFLDGIQKTLSIVERRTTIPILNNVLIRAGGKNDLGVIATNREIGLVAHYEAEVRNPGEITLSARKLYEMIREIQGDFIHVKTNEMNWVNVSCGKVSYRIPGISADDYPKVESDDKQKFFMINSGILTGMIEKTFFAMSQEEMRINLNGVFMEVEQGEAGSRVRMVATDGHRLSMVDMDLGAQKFLELEKGIIIPRRGVGEIKKLLEHGDEDVEVGVEKGMIVMKKKNTLLKISLIDADYPDYKRVITMDKGNRVELDRDQFLHALRRMGVMATDKYNGVKIGISGDRMKLNSTNPDVGEANDEVDIAPQDKEMEAVYNVRYLIDAVEVMDEEKLVFEMREGLRPGTIRPVVKENYLCIIMPLKV